MVCVLNIIFSIALFHLIVKCLIIFCYSLLYNLIRYISVFNSIVSLFFMYYNTFDLELLVSSFGDNFFISKPKCHFLVFYIKGLLCILGILELNGIACFRFSISKTWGFKCTIYITYDISQRVKPQKISVNIFVNQ